MHILRTISAISLLGLIGTTPAGAECKCLNRGVEVPEGKTACIKTNSGPQLALCEKNLNVTNWKFLGEECPLARGGDSAKPDKVELARLEH